MRTRVHNKLLFFLIGLLVVLIVAGSMLLLSFVYANPTSSLPPSPSGLQLYYMFDDGLGSTVADSSGNNNTGTCYNSPSWVAGMYGDALSFSYASPAPYVKSSTTIGLPTGSSSRTVCGWVQINNVTTNTGLFGYGTTATGEMFGIGVYQNHIYFQGYFADVSGTTTLSANTWYFLAVTYDGSTIRVYVNGALDNSRTESLNTVMTNDYFSVGRISSASWGLNRGVTSIIDDVRVYNVALSATQIQNLYYYTIASSSDSHSQISPLGNTLVLAGNSQTFTYSASSGYTLNQLLIDGVSTSLKTYPSSYTFSTVSANHTISVSSARALSPLNHFTISVPSSEKAGSSFGNVTVTAYNSLGQIIVGYAGSVYFTSSDSHAVLPYTSSSKFTFTSGDSGKHAFDGFKFKKAGSQTITVTDPSADVSQTSSAINVSPVTTDLMTYFTISAIAIIIAIAIVGIPMLMKKHARTQTHLDEYFWKENIRAEHSMTTVGFNKIYVRVKKYLRENWGSPFIVAFMLLLLSAAFSLTVGLPSLASAVAVYAFYALVAGVILQFASFLKYRKRDGETA
jgi:hypothetical protein